MCSGLPGILSKYDGLVDWELRDRSAMSVDLAPLRYLLHQLKNPQKQFRTIHIAGTKGEGSVSALIEAGLDQCWISLRPILFTSCRANNRTDYIRWPGNQRGDVGDNDEPRVVSP